MVVTVSWGGLPTLWDNAPNGRRIDLATELRHEELRSRIPTAISAESSAAAREEGAPAVPQTSTLPGQLPFTCRRET